jgi:hypothetical protein
MSHTPTRRSERRSKGKRIVDDGQTREDLSVTGRRCGAKHAPFAVLWVTWWLFISGVFAIVAAMMERNVGLTWGWTLAFGVLCIVAGVFAIMSPPATVATIMGFIAAFALLSGILHLVGAFALSSAKSEVGDALHGAAM